MKGPTVTKQSNLTHMSAGEPGSRGFPLPSLLALTMASFIATANESMPAGLLPRIAADFGISQAGAGQLVTCCAFGAGLAAIPLTSLTAGWQRRRLLVAALLVFVVGNVVTAATDCYPLALLSRLVIGLATGVTWSLLAGYARRLVTSERQGGAMALAMAGIPLALALGMPLGSWLGALAGWRSVFFLLAAMGVSLIAWVYAAVPQFDGEPEHRRMRLAQLVMQPGIRPILLVLALWIFAHYLLYTYIASLLAWLGFARLLEPALLLFGLSAVAGNWLVGMMIDRWLRYLVLGCLAVFTATAAVLSLEPANSVLIYVAIATWGLSFGGAPTLLQTALADHAGEHADSAQSILVTVFNLAFAASSGVGGVLLQSGGAGMLPVAVVVMLATAATVAWLASRAGFAPGARSR
ncbi:putative MFS family arabinose efflux permease [Herbaspirillum sp. SJZ099]|nr:putative MFS family arabinose efflux permease [Herbaspirillum sp. SJZ099]